MKKKKTQMYSVPLLTCKVIKERVVRFRSTSVDHADMAADMARAFIGSADRENMVAFFVDGKNDIVGVHTVAVGGMHAMCTTPREVFRAALLTTAAGVILAHNHPSGDPLPSKEDKAFTHRCLLAGDLLGIPLLDHVIVTRDAHYSFMSDGQLTRSKRT